MAYPPDCYVSMFDQLIIGARASGNYDFILELHMNRALYGYQITVQWAVVQVNMQAQFLLDKRHGHGRPSDE